MAAGRVSSPGPGQVELPVNQRVPAGGRVAEIDSDLGVLDPPGRPGVLPLHPGRGGALLQVTRSHQRPAPHPGSPKCSTTKPRRSSRTPSASQQARASRCCIPSGVASPACSAIVQQFLRGKAASRPSTNARDRRRGSTRRKRGPIRIISSSSNPSHLAGSTLWPAATARSSRVNTTRDDHAVAVPRPAPPHPRSRSTAGVLVLQQHFVVSGLSSLVVAGFGAVLVAAAPAGPGPGGGPGGEGGDQVCQETADLAEREADEAAARAFGAVAAVTAR